MPTTTNENNRTNSNSNSNAKKRKRTTTKSSNSAAEDESETKTATTDSLFYQQLSICLNGIEAYAKYAAQLIYVHQQQEQFMPSMSQLMTPSSSAAAAAVVAPVAPAEKKRKEKEKEKEKEKKPQSKKSSSSSSTGAATTTTMATTSNASASTSSNHSSMMSADKAAALLQLRRVHFYPDTADVCLMVVPEIALPSKKNRKELPTPSIPEWLSHCTIKNWEFFHGKIYDLKKVDSKENALKRFMVYYIPRNLLAYSKYQGLDPSIRFAFITMPSDTRILPRFQGFGTHLADEPIIEDLSTATELEQMKPKGYQLFTFLMLKNTSSSSSAGAGNNSLTKRCFLLVGQLDALEQLFQSLWEQADSLKNPTLASSSMKATTMKKDSSEKEEEAEADADAAADEEAESGSEKEKEKEPEPERKDDEKEKEKEDHQQQQQQ
jgi:hypothetical protein